MFSEFWEESIIFNSIKNEVLLNYMILGVSQTNGSRVGSFLLESGMSLFSCRSVSYQHPGNVFNYLY